MQTCAFTTTRRSNGVFTILLAALAALALAITLDPAAAFASVTNADANALSPQGSNAMSVQSSKATYYYTKFHTARLKVTKSGFKTFGKLKRGSTAVRATHSGKTIKKKARTFKLANKVRVAGSDWLSFYKTPKAQMLTQLKSMAKDRYHGMVFKVAKDRVTEIRWCA